eukprot:TRINITY_DN65733_c6_g2_i1.p1 TRINITY_DN65733_c6_g2~~TRINITY_DN65733_c6_g2_i1.p1  ORF type:complete len:919 (+),score=170.03 TRINITY_DN65733_c6_g2_i1:375-2759(+)
MYTCMQKQPKCWAQLKANGTCCKDQAANANCPLGCGSCPKAPSPPVPPLPTVPKQCNAARFQTCITAAGINWAECQKKAKAGTVSCPCLQAQYTCLKQQKGACWQTTVASGTCCKEQAKCSAMNCYDACPSKCAVSIASCMQEKGLTPASTDQCRYTQAQVDCALATKCYDSAMDSTCKQTKMDCLGVYFLTCKGDTPIPGCNITKCLIAKGYNPNNVNFTKGKACDYIQASMDCAIGEKGGCYDARQKSICTQRLNDCPRLSCPDVKPLVPQCDVQAFSSCFGNGRQSCLAKVANGTFNPTSTDDCSCYSRMYRCYAQQGEACWNKVNGTAKCCGLKKAAGASCDLKCDGKCPSKADLCANYNCNNGYCRVVNQVPQCDCTSGWVGTFCTQKSSCTGYCKNNGLCYVGAFDDKVHCDCIASWTGDRCDKKTDPAKSPCAKLNCKNGGVCFIQAETGLIDPFCVCKNGFRGETCEIADPCASRPCAHGSCDSDWGDYYCDCDQGWSGVNCSVADAKLCVTNPCQNGGTCVAKYGQEICNCAPKWFGDKCTKTTAPVVKSPCDQQKLFTCMKNNLTQSDPNDPKSKCQSFKNIAECGTTYNCLDYVKIWCGSLFTGAPDCKIPQCSKQPTNCNMNVYKSCYRQLQKESLADFCTFRKDFLDCPKDAKCPDLLVYLCSETRKNYPNCNVNAKCPAASSQATALTIDRSPLMDQALQLIEGRPFTSGNTNADKYHNWDEFVHGTEQPTSRPASHKSTLVVVASGCALVVVAVAIAVVVARRRRSDLEAPLLDEEDLA